MLSGCAHYGSSPYTKLPEDLSVCFENEVSMPDKGGLSKKQVIKLISDLKRSEKSKTQCGKRLITLYNAYLK